LGQLVVVGEDHRAALSGQSADLVLQRRDALEHQRCRGGVEHREVHVRGMRIRDRSRAAALWVIAPTDTKSTPVVATSESVWRVTPPLASSSARPATWATASRSCAGVMLSNSSRGAPAARAS